MRLRHDVPLQGLRVIDAGTMIAGPLAGCLLADFGADVIKIEHPRYGDPMRQWAPIKNEVSLWWKVTARNKRLITLDLGHPRGQDIFRQLVGQADILIENFRPGTMEKWGLGYEVLSQINPQLVMVRVSGYGQGGPYRDRPGYGTIAEAITGVPSFTGFPDKPPTLSAWPLADSVAAVFAALGAMFAIHYRDVHKGEGQVVDVSLYEPLFRLVESQVIGFDQLGIVKQRMGNRMAEDSPRNTYETADGEWIAISASSQRTFERLARAIGRPQIVDDPRFKDNPSRVDHADELDEVLSAWFSPRSFAEAMTILEEHDVVAGPIYDVRRIFADPHFAAREDIVAIEDPDLGIIRMQNVAPRLSKTPGQVVHGGLSLGHHNREVYAELLSLSEGELKGLQQQGVI